MLSGTAPNQGITDSFSGGGGTQGILDYQHMSVISELVQIHQAKLSDSNFTSFLSNFYELIVCLKLLGVS